ncbi:MAG: hypothetical protein JRN26_02900 [Nitrososphaerota archaeon]|jgi:uncharacterized membrane protein (DUF106 family)|nr:hypothetical protein [Nitrososphaerota archaeon]MDG6928285.1 hypothetical protein [Nitrososphaerota archaeon]MDG6931564.1 hypothetical protein [Nitrososphaerota archaeon]MDG6935823.1 hypothetical protein [Nitrososphaerota archaeon]MDG6943482.1 hypothetical protein [Nitrososphaerota archaeon]
MNRLVLSSALATGGMLVMFLSIPVSRFFPVNYQNSYGFFQMLPPALMMLVGAVLVGAAAYNLVDRERPYFFRTRMTSLVMGATMTVFAWAAYVYGAQGYVIAGYLVVGIILIAGAIFRIFIQAVRQ